MPLAAFLTHDGTKDLFLAGVAHPELISPDNWASDFGFMMQRPHAARINFDLLFNPPAPGP